MNEWLFDNGAELLSRSIPPQRWIIDSLLPEGLTLLCGSPKAGKSWLSLDIALHVASGQAFWGHKTTAGKVLLFALEDGERRLKRRLEMLIANHEELSPALIYPCFSVPPLESGFASGLEKQLQDFGSGEKVSLVIVDTLGKVREPSRLDGYQRDYQQVAALKAIADKHHIAVLVVHHLLSGKACTILVGPHTEVVVAQFFKILSTTGNVLLLHAEGDRGLCVLS